MSINQRSSFSAVNQNSANRPTIGYIIRDTMSTNFDIPIWKSISDLAEDLNVNMITYMTHPMWYSQNGLDLNFGVYQQINTKMLEGLISFDMGLPWVFNHLQHFAKAPNVIINYPIKGYPCFTIGQEGMRYAVDHLLDVHHKKRILYISGNKGNLEAEARLIAYKNSLESH
jgi:DNA-binding LacI/PurR family transcriptional regulator